MSLEDHVHQICHLNDLTIIKAQSLVVVQNCIHVFDPVSIYRSIKNHPLSLSLRVFVGAASENTA